MTNQQHRGLMFLGEGRERGKSASNRLVLPGVHLRWQMRDERINH
jgi:hypothetical protein